MWHLYQSSHGLHVHRYKTWEVKDEPWSARHWPVGNIKEIFQTIKTQFSAFWASLLSGVTGTDQIIRMRNIVNIVFQAWSQQYDTTGATDPAKLWLVKMKTLLMFLLPVAITMEDEKTRSLQKNIITTTTGAKLPWDSISKSFKITILFSQQKFIDFSMVLRYYGLVMLILDIVDCCLRLSKTRYSNVVV